MKVQGAKILVTGADGFIGSHLVEALLDAGAAVRALVYYNSFSSRGWLDALPPAKLAKLEIVAGDIRDFHSLSAHCAGADAVFHLAALIAIPFSYTAPDLYIETNIKGTANVLNAVRANGIKRLIHTSTSEVYGTAREVPMPETHPLNAQSPYAATKIGAEQLALSYFASYDLPVSIVRPFNTFGPRQSARAVIPAIITQIAGGARSLRLGSTEPTRDFSYVSDTVAGMIAVCESEKTAGEIVNLGSGFEISIGETARMIAELMDAEISFELDPRRLRPEKSEVGRLCADIAKVRQRTGWSPALGGADGLRRGLKTTVDWFTKPENLAHYRPGEWTT